MKKAIAFCNCFFQLYSPYGEWYCCAVIFGFLPSDIRFASVRANIISLLHQQKYHAERSEVYHHLFTGKEFYDIIRWGDNNAGQHFAL